MSVWHDYVQLLGDGAHWMFEITLMVIFDGLLIGLGWPLVKRLVKRHDAEHHEAPVAPAAEIDLGFPDLAEHERKPQAPSYHDLYITTDLIPRISIFDLPYNHEVRCERVSGWTLWDTSKGVGRERRLAGEYDEDWLVLDVNGVVICGRPKPEQRSVEAPASQRYVYSEVEGRAVPRQQAFVVRRGRASERIEVQPHTHAVLPGEQAWSKTAATEGHVHMVASYQKHHGTALCWTLSGEEATPHG